MKRNKVEAQMEDMLAKASKVTPGCKRLQIIVTETVLPPYVATISSIKIIMAAQKRYVELKKKRYSERGFKSGFNEGVAWCVAIQLKAKQRKVAK